MKNLPLTLIGFLLVGAPIISADMGSIPFTEGVVISEPAQDAIIAWNGEEQLLYLQTTLSASQETRVLEVMPLPSRPTVHATTEQVFRRCAALLPPVRTKRSLFGVDSFGPQREEPPAAAVVEKKIIGAHNLSIVQLLDKTRFSEWIESEFGEVGELEVPEALLEVIADYTEDGFTWFLFDVVDLKPELAKKTPLRIQFKTHNLFYPMRITRTEKGFSKVSLTIITNVLFEKEDCVGIPRSEIVVPARPRAVAGNRIQWADPLIFNLLGQPATVQMRTWEISGQIDSFQADLLIRNPKFPNKEDQQ